MEIKIPFDDEFREPMITDVKIMTSRTRRYGDPADTFTVFEQQFNILAVIRLELEFVARIFYIEEGCDSPKHFRQVWKKLHKKRYVGNQLVYTHIIKRIKGPAL